MATAVLVVEDDPRAARALARIADEYGPVRVATTLAEGRDAVGATPAISAVLLDVGLPDGSGLSLMPSLREGGRATPVLVLTALRDDRVTRFAQLYGAEFLPKPWERDNIVAFLSRALRRGRATDPTGLASAWARTYRLTRRELQIVEQLLLGTARARLPAELGVSPNTVKTQVRSLLRKTRQPNLAALAADLLRRVAPSEDH